MRRTFSILAVSLLLYLPTICRAQIATNLKISEVMTDNRSGLIDEYGNRTPWIEIYNTSWGTVNLQSCYLTNDRRALNENLSVPDRAKLMSQIPKGDDRTALEAQRRIVFYADAAPNMGTLHTSFRLEKGKSNFIALFDGDGHTLLDSVTVPASLGADCSYAAFLTGGKAMKWEVCPPAKVTPGNANSKEGMTDDKVAEFKEKDPYGFGMAILGMGIVFSCLILLSAFFYFFGKIFSRKNTKHSANKADEAAAKSVSTGSDSGKDEIAAVIALAVHSALSDIHDYESGVITIKTHPSKWNPTGGLYTTEK